MRFLSLKFSGFWVPKARRCSPGFIGPFKSSVFVLRDQTKKKGIAQEKKRKKLCDRAKQKKNSQNDHGSFLDSSCVKKKKVAVMYMI